MSSLPNHAPRFDVISEDHYLPAVEAAIDEARKNIAAIKAETDAASFENTIVALDCASETLDQVAGIFYSQLSSMGGDGLNALAEKIGPMAAAFSNDVMLDAELFARVKAVHERKDDLGLDVEQSKLLDDSYKQFVRGGALLEPRGQERFREISAELSVLSPTFSNNTVKAKEAFELLLTEEAQIAGLPDGIVVAARHAAQEKGHDQGWLITLDFPSYLPFLQFADDRDLREKVWRAFSGAAWKDDFDNSDNVLKIVNLRQERANLLGFVTHAHYVLEERMAKTPENVLSFLEKLKNAYKPAAESDIAALEEFATNRDGINSFNPWDVQYYSEKLKEKLFDFSSEDLRPYFQLDKVLEGCFSHFTKLLGVKFEEASGYPTWHKDVKAFDVIREDTGDFLGTLYADFHPRPGKRAGAWQTTFRDQGMFHGKVERPVAAIVCNFTKPTPETPSLITHNEVTTLFHEMGHALHALSSDVTYRSVGGTNVMWDFVELPSQLQENWCYEKEALDLFASHYETGELIPKELIDKLRASRNFMGGYAGLRQVSLGTVDMAWHTSDPADITDVAEFEDEASADTTLFPRLAGPVSTSFAHIFAGGYSAGYYSYKWAEVLDADAFELFLEKGLYDQETAKRYQKELLTRGGTEDPNTLYENFRGRKADPDALLRREGLADGTET